MSRRKCKSYLITAPRRKKRVVLHDGDTMASLLADLSRRFDMVEILEIRDESGCAIDRVEDIFDDDTLVIIPAGYTEKDIKKEGKDGDDGKQEELVKTAGGAAPLQRHSSRGAPTPDNTSVVELQVLSTATAADFDIDVVVGGGQNGIVFATKCTRPGLPRPQKTYATKLVFNFGITTKTGTANTFENEYFVLSVLPPHPNVMRFWGTFWDKIPDAALHHLPTFAQEQAVYRDHAGDTQRRKAQFVILDYHPQSLQSHLRDLPAPLPYRTALEFAVDLLRGVAHLHEHRVAHLDLKTDNVLVAHDSRLVICDFGTALQFSTPAMEIPFRQGLAPGGNQLHLAPEVLNDFNAAIRRGRGGVISYARQGVWAVGAMVYEMAVRTPPFPDYPNDCRGPGPDHRIVYEDSDLPAFPSSYPPAFGALVRQMLAYDPADRLELQDALAQAESLLQDLVSSEEEVLCSPSTPADDEAEPLISVNVKAVTGTSMMISVPRSTRVADVIALTARQLLMGDNLEMEPPLHEMFLLFAGTRCANDMTLDEVGVEGESCVHLVWVHQPSGGAGHGAGAGGGHLDPLFDGFGKEGEDDEGVGGPVEASPIFNTITMHPVLKCIHSGTTIIGSSVTWGTAVIDQHPVRHGRHVWQFRVDALVPPNRGGMAIGIVAKPFDTGSGILGAHSHSWGYSGRTGDKGDGSGFVRYGERYGNGDIVGVDLDLDAGTLSFSKNGVSQGVAFDTGLTGRSFLAGVCIGGVQKEGGYHQATVVSMVQKGSHSFSTLQRHRAITLSTDHMTAQSEDRAWGTVIVAEPPVLRGRHRWEFEVDQLLEENKGGMAVGVVTSYFPVDSGILGATSNSWAYSGRTGDKGDGGRRFHHYGEPYGTGDRVGVLLDMEANEIRFTKNGHDQGVAYKGVFSKENIGHGVQAAVCIGGIQRQRATTYHHPNIELSNYNSTARGSVKQWGTVLVDGVAVDMLNPLYKGGMAIGVVTEHFDVASGILGAHAGSWGYSGRTGDKGDGIGGFQKYGESFGTNDTVEILLDMDIGELSFSKNGVPQGIAFREGLKGERLFAAVCIGGVHREGGFHAVTLWA